MVASNPQPDPALQALPAAMGTYPLCDYSQIQYLPDSDDLSSSKTIRHDKGNIAPDGFDAKSVRMRGYIATLWYQAAFGPWEAQAAGGVDNLRQPSDAFRNRAKLEGWLKKAALAAGTEGKSTRGMRGVWEFDSGNSKQGLEQGEI